MLTSRHSEHGERNRTQRFESDIYKTLIKNWIFDETDETDKIEIRLPCYESFLNILEYDMPAGLCTQTLYSWIKGVLKKFNSFVYTPDVEAILATSQVRNILPIGH